jgi:endonuclease/exonuclease/phosphatase (EEP) superfamily protein YafD
MRVVRSFLGGLGLLLVTVCTALALLAQGGRVNALLDAITHIAPFLLAGTVAGALLTLLLAGRARTAGLVLGLVGAALAVSLIVPEYRRDAGPTTARGASGEIKVIQVNAWRGNRDVDRIARWLKAENPDFAIVEEATPALRDQILLLTGWSTAGAESNTIIFSRQPFLVMKRPRLGPRSKLTFVNATYDNPSGPIEVVVTHLPRPNDPDYLAAAAALRIMLPQRPRDRMILAGDFNSTPWSFQRRSDDEHLGLTRRDRAMASWPAGHAAQWPWPAPFPFLPIDHIYAGPGWATTSVTRGPRLGSDHYPLIVTLAPVAPR